jgi:hypothetical protein
MIQEEGFGAMLFRLATMYKLIREHNRTIIITPFYGRSHYPDIQHEISLCEYFVLPSLFECPINTTRKDLKLQIRHMNITCAKYPDIAHNLSALKTIGCFEGLMHYGYLNKLHWDFTPYSKSLLTIGNRLLNLHNSPLIVFHWRRGDQLTTRCGHTDKSINCGTVESFINDVETHVALFETDQSSENVRVYIATDEDHIDVLQKFDDKGYKHSMYMVSEALRQNITFNSADSIIIDLMLMCIADAFISYGITTINAVANNCRSRQLF